MLNPLYQTFYNTIPQLFAIAIPEFYWLSEKPDQDELDEIPF